MYIQFEILNTKTGKNNLSMKRILKQNATEYGIRYFGIDVYDAHDTWCTHCVL